jgi:hypothetical protein
MTAISITPGYPTFADTDGSPLNDGYVYIGLENQDPITAPTGAFWDKAFQVPADQPLRTSGGYIVRNGTPAAVYTGASYSILVQNKNLVTVYNAPSAVITNVTINVEEITQYQGAFATAPTTRDNGTPLETGDIYFNTTSDDLFVYNSIWVLVTPTNTADITSGTIDGAVIGGVDPAAITGTSVTGNTVTGTTSVTGNTIVGTTSVTGDTVVGTTSVTGGTVAATTSVTGGTVAATTSVTGATVIGTTSVTGLTVVSTDDATINGILVGRGSGNAATNTVVGLNALSSNDPAGNYNTAIGNNALQDNTTGDFLTAVGFNAMTGNTTGSLNIGMGWNCLKLNESGSLNVAIGPSSLSSLVASSYNTAVGTNALLNANGSNNLEIRSGSSPAFNITTQSNHISLGSSTTTNAYIKVAWTITSDERDKMNFANVPLGLNFVNNLTPVAYQHKLSREEPEAHGPVRYGFKAQDILALEGDNAVIVDSSDPESLRLSESNLFAVLVKAIQELKAELDEYKAAHP